MEVGILIRDKETFCIFEIFNMSFLLRYSYDCCAGDEPFAKCYDYTTAQKDSQSYMQGHWLNNEGLEELMLAVFGTLV